MVEARKCQVKGKESVSFFNKDLYRGFECSANCKPQDAVKTIKKGTLKRCNNVLIYAINLFFKFVGQRSLQIDNDLFQESCLYLSSSERRSNSETECILLDICLCSLGFLQTP